MTITDYLKGGLVYGLILTVGWWVKICLVTPVWPG